MGTSQKKLLAGEVPHLQALPRLEKKKSMARILNLDLGRRNLYYRAKI